MRWKLKDTPPKLRTVWYNGVQIGDVPDTGDQEKNVEIARQFLKDKGLHQEVSLFQSMVSQAMAFANTSAMLYEKDLRHLPRKGASLAPFVVNATFSIELYLKALAQKHGVVLKGHELSKLYGRLPSLALEEISSVIPQCATRRALGEEPNFPAYIDNLNNSFVEWRYLYEKEKTGTIFIEPTIFVMEVLHESCRLPQRE